MGIDRAGEVATIMSFLDRLEAEEALAAGTAPARSAGYMAARAEAASPGKARPVSKKKITKSAAPQSSSDDDSDDGDDDEHETPTFFDGSEAGASRREDPYMEARAPTEPGHSDASAAESDSNSDSAAAAAEDNESLLSDEEDVDGPWFPGAGGAQFMESEDARADAEAEAQAAELAAYFAEAAQIAEKQPTETSAKPASGDSGLFKKGFLLDKRRPSKKLRKEGERTTAPPASRIMGGVVERDTSVQSRDLEEAELLMQMRSITDEYYSRRTSQLELQTANRQLHESDGDGTPDYYEGISRFRAIRTRAEEIGRARLAEMRQRAALGEQPFADAAEAAAGEPTELVLEVGGSDDDDGSEKMDAPRAKTVRFEPTVQVAQAVEPEPEQTEQVREQDVSGREESAPAKKMSKFKAARMGLA